MKEDGNIEVSEVKVGRDFCVDLMIAFGEWLTDIEDDSYKIMSYKLNSRYDNVVTVECSVLRDCLSPTNSTDLSVEFWDKHSEENIGFTKFDTKYIVQDIGPKKTSIDVAGYFQRGIERSGTPKWTMTSALNPSNDANRDDVQQNEKGVVKKGHVFSPDVMKTFAVWLSQIETISENVRILAHRLSGKMDDAILAECSLEDSCRKPINGMNYAIDFWKNNSSKNIGFREFNIEYNDQTVRIDVKGLFEKPCSVDKLSGRTSWKVLS